ncbi:MAG: hypothetical protein HY763_05570 [Planctomycetes bacterium]|nr:hypothetical protein [Planctomycetota bacterium]
MLHRGRIMLWASVLACVPAARGQAPFVNWETPHVHPLDITPDGSRLFAVNTADNRLEVFDITSATAVRVASIPVGLDPVSVRAASNDRAWVVNHISDSVSIVDLVAGSVVATLRTADEPCDVAFAGTPRRAFVSCSQANRVLVFDPANLATAPVSVAIEGEDPRSIAVSAAGNEVYVAIFESGNRTTILGGGSTLANGYPPNAVNSPLSPYFNPGQPLNPGINPPNPPPNNGTAFRPPMRPGNPPPPRVGLIVRRDAAGRWMDDNAHEWTDLVSGANAAASGRPVGWDLYDHDVAIIDATTLAVRYAGNVMNLCMALAVNPGTGRVTVVGTEATNEVRFEPVLAGRFLRVNFGSVDPAGPTTLPPVDLNPHLVYTTAIPFAPIPQPQRDLSIGDPRAIVWQSSGAVGYVAGMGSNNVILIDTSGARLPATPPIPVGEGPTGLALDEGRSRLYVLNKFAASVSVVDTNTRAVFATVPLFDPTPPPIRAGRKHLYDTHRNSGLGHISCASCHADARMDRLAWDLGDPGGTVKPFNQNCNGPGCQPWHPMKGPMVTQTLQDIIGKEPHHWRGDRNGLEEFAGAFRTLLGDDAPLPPAEMQEFENFLAGVRMPPNPFRTFDNTLPTDLPLPGHFTSGRFAPAGTPLPNGNALAALTNYRLGLLDAVNCVTCHTLPTGIGPDGFFAGGTFNPLPPGPNGERHHAIVAVDGSTNVSMKVPQLRNLFDKVGFEATQQRNLAGFGFLHDGSVDSLSRFVTEPVFNLRSDQEVADMVAFMLAFSGSDLPQGSPTNPLEPPGTPSQDVHAAVGWQTTLVSEAAAGMPQLELIADMQTLADSNAVGLVVKGVQAGIPRGYSYLGAGQFQSDRQAETVSAATLRAGAAPGSELTYTVVPKGSETRIGIDRDVDGFFDRDELDGCSDPADPASVPPQCTGCQFDADCNDGIACTLDTCDVPSGACQHTPDHALCDDSSACNGVEFCDAASGCLPGVLLSDCNSNGVEDACDIAADPAADADGNGVLDVCENVNAPLADGTLKNRYLSFVPNNDVSAVAFRVELVASTYFPASAGIVGWVGVPDAGGVARLSPVPVFRAWPEPMIHVGDCAVVPVAEYSVAGTMDGVVFGPAAPVRTIEQPGTKFWGDSVGSFDGVWSGPNGVVNVNDYLAALQHFVNDPSAPPLAWVDVADETPNAVVNFNDVFRLVKAFQGEAYPFGDPMSCP